MWHTYFFKESSLGHKLQTFILTYVAYLPMEARLFTLVKVTLQGEEPEDLKTTLKIIGKKEKRHLP